jgi:hypothetical protein
VRGARRRPKARRRPSFRRRNRHIAQSRTPLARRDPQGEGTGPANPRTLAQPTINPRAWRRPSANMLLKPSLTPICPDSRDVSGRDTRGHDAV